jgi:hypothetical protein
MIILLGFETNTDVLNKVRVLKSNFLVKFLLTLAIKFKVIESECVRGAVVIEFKFGNILLPFGLSLLDASWA